MQPVLVWRKGRERESLVLDHDLGRPLICPPLSALLLPLRHHLPAQRQKPSPSAGLTIQAWSTPEKQKDIGQLVLGKKVLLRLASELQVAEITKKLSPSPADQLSSIPSVQNSLQLVKMPCLWGRGLC